LPIPGVEPRSSVVQPVASSIYRQAVTRVVFRDDNGGDDNDDVDFNNNNNNNNHIVESTGANRQNHPQQ
jgi:hypothetical protein